MIKRRSGAASALLPLLAGGVFAGCASAYPELKRDIDAAVAAAEPTGADSAAAAAAVANRGAAAGATSAPAQAAPAGPVAGTPAAAPGAVPGAATAMPSAAQAGAPTGSRVTSVANLPSPEAAVIDTAAGLLLVAGSETGPAGARGVIMRLDMNGDVRDARWIVGGVKTAVLRAPRGMAIVGDTLWIADRTMLRAFGRNSGRPIATVALGPLGATSLSDVAVGGDGALYVADAAVTYSARGVPQRNGTARIYRIEGRKPSVALEHARLEQPTAVSWDPIMARLLIGSSKSDTILAWRPGQQGPETVAVPTGGPWDGVVSVGGTAFYVTSAARGEVQFYQNGVGRSVVQGARGAGDVAVDLRAGRIVIPIPGERRVEVWEVRR